MRYGGAAREDTQVKINSNGTLDVNQNGSYTNGRSETTTKRNEVDVTFPKDQSLDTVLDTVLTAWIILVQRYQRDAFHQFSWGIKGAGSDKCQCISAVDLDLPNYNNAASLVEKVRDSRLHDVSLDGTTIFLNDGTKEEVRLNVQRLLASD